MAKQDTFVAISVDSILFNTTNSTLKAIDGTLLSKLDRLSDYFDENRNIYCFDRDPEIFRYILNIHRNKEIHFPRNVCPILFKEELKFWEIPFKLIAPCCWKYLYEAEGNIEDLQKVISEDNEFDAHKKVNKITPILKDNFLTSEHKVKDKRLNGSKSIASPSKVWLFLTEPASSKAATIWCYFYICVALLSVILYIIWLNPSVRVSRYLCTTEDSVDVFKLNDAQYKYSLKIYNEKILMAAATDPHPALLAIDVLCLSFFILEIVLSVCVCPDLMKYFTDGYNLMKIFVSASMLVSFVLEFNKSALKGNINLARLLIASRCFNVLRLLLIFRLHKMYNTLHVMLLALRHSVKELLLLLFTFLTAVVVYGCLIFSAEIETEMFPTTQISMWWALITMTTIGYGDYYPVSTFGYIVGVVCAINGIIVLALPIAAIAGTFSNLFARNSEFQKHKLAIKNQKQSEYGNK